MTKNEFKELHGFDDEAMAKIADFREFFGAKKPCKVKPITDDPKEKFEW